MIVCKQCGHQNEDDDLFCGNCPAFLEYSGERIGGPEPVLDGGLRRPPNRFGDEDPARDQRLRSPAPRCRRGPDSRQPARPPGSWCAVGSRTNRLTGGRSPGADTIRRRTRRGAGGETRPAPTARRPAGSHAAHARGATPANAAARDQRSPSRPRAARSIRATSSVVRVARATIRNATTAVAAVRRSPRRRSPAHVGSVAGRSGRRSVSRPAIVPAVDESRVATQRAERVVHAASSWGSSPTSSGSWPCWRSSASASVSRYPAFARG